MKIKLLLLLVISSYSITSHSRMAREEDFSYIVESTHSDVILNNDGSSLYTISWDYKITKEKGVQDLAVYKISFDPSTEEVTVLSAQVDNGGQIHKVNNSNIQKSTVAAKDQGLVNINEIAVPFSQLKVGSKVNVKYKILLKPGAFGKFYSGFFSYGENLFVKKDSLKIVSPKKLFFKSKDLTGLLKISQHKDKQNNFIFEAHMSRPFTNTLVEELGALANKDRVSLEVANIDKWDTLRKLFNVRLPAAKSTSLPQELKSVVGTIPASLPIDKKLDLLLKYVTTKYRYLGDWRGQGKYIPKPLNKIVEDKFGDCKDFSTLMLAMLKEMDINANYALVDRSYRSAEVNESNIPSISYFNHMIVRVEDKGVVFWVDPTNGYSVGTKIRKDISDRNAFVLGETGPIFEKIPKLDYSKNSFGILKEYIFTSPTEAAVATVVKTTGENAYISWDAINNKDAQTIQDTMMKTISVNETKVVTDFEFSKNEEKVYKDMVINAKYMAKNLGVKNQIELAHTLRLPPLSIASIFSRISKEDKGDLDISLVPPMNVEYQYKNIFMTGNYPVVCDIESDWVDASRKIEKTPGGFYLKDKFVVKKEILTPLDYANDGFQLVANNISNCFAANPVSYNFESISKLAKVQSSGRAPASTGHTDINAVKEEGFAKFSPEKKIIARRELAFKILDASIEDIIPDGLTKEDARLMLEKNLEENPKDAGSLQALALYYYRGSYISGKNYEMSGVKRAEQFINKSAEADPKDLSIKLTKIMILNTLAKNDEAKTILYDQVLKVDKSKIDFQNARNIMRMLNEFKDVARYNEYFDVAFNASKNDNDKGSLYAGRASARSSVDNHTECIADYLKAESLRPLGAWENGNLAVCYNNNNQYDEAISYCKKAIAIADYGAVHFTLARAYRYKGFKLFEEDKLTEAEAQFHLSILENREPSHAHRGLVEVYLVLKNESKAREHALKSIATSDKPDDLRVRFENAFKQHNIPFK